VAWRGISDLAVGDQKFSGTAQRRKRSHFLFHGTILYGFDLPLIEKYLRHPQAKDEPDYREGRDHLGFLTQLPLPAPKIKQLISQVWNAESPLPYHPQDSVAELIKTRYSLPEWNLKY
jgi:lipoate-protein ligase A